jgi:malate dehydrogenase (oxaloacetate-decarboxylating)(NADP+)
VLETIKNLGITVIIGVSGVPEFITKEIVEALVKNVECPVVFVLFNPTNKTECNAQQVYEWFDRKVLFYSGSPFPNYEYGSKTLIPAQANNNNSWIFPAVGFTLVAVKARKCPAKVFKVSALALTKLVKQEYLDQSSLLISLAKIHNYVYDISLAVAKFLIAEGHTVLELPADISFEYYLKSEQFTSVNSYEPYY